MPTTVSIAEDISLAEGHGGLTYFVFTVNRTGDLSGPTVLDYAVAGSGASMALGSDFQGGSAPSGKVFFGGGESVKQIWIAVAGDTTAEAAETFTVTLSNPSGATLGDGVATGTILNDDGAPTGAVLEIRNGILSRDEGDAGVTEIVFTVTRTGDLSAASSVDWIVAGGGPAGGIAAKHATADDFLGGVLPSGTVHFAAGQAAAAVTVAVAGDTLAEANESFLVRLQNPTGATLGGITAGFGLIQNDDDAPPSAVIAMQNGSLSRDEGDASVTEFVFTVTRSGDVSAASSVDWILAGGGPAGGIAAKPATADDFVGAALPSGTVHFAAGQSVAAVTIAVAGDTLAEADENFLVRLQNPTGATLGGITSGFGLIRNDDAATAPPPSTAIQSGPGADYYSATADDDVYAYDAVGDGADVIFNYDASGEDSLQISPGAFPLANQSGAGAATAVLADPGASIAGADVVIWSHWSKLDSAAKVDSMLMNQPGTFDGGVIVVALNAGQKVAVYYDADANSAGGVNQIVSLDNLVSPTSLGAADFLLM